MTRLILIFLCLCITTSTHAQLYKCKRADGSSTFQDTECPDGSTSTKIAAPRSVTAQSLTLTADTRGHFHTLVSINNVTVPGMIDTGASMLAISSEVAHSMGISTKDAKPAYIQTANGVITSYIKNMPLVKVGDVELYNVDVAIAPATPTLIGMSALKQFKINEENGQLVLVRK